MSDQNWRTDVDAGDYFLHQKKQVQLSDRRPVIRKSSDLVGPGIGAGAVRLADYNDLLATFNGYYSSAPGAANAPNSTESFIGQVVSDAELGGLQIFTGLTSGVEYRRTFTRSSVDAESIGWGNWSGQRIPPSAASVWAPETRVFSNTPTVLTAPQIGTVGDAAIYERSDGGVLLRKQGVYTGFIEVMGTTVIADVVDSITLLLPGGGGSSLTRTDLAPMLTKYYPFTVWTTDETQGFTVTLEHSGAARNFAWTFQCTRVGDAI